MRIFIVVVSVLLIGSASAQPLDGYAAPDPGIETFLIGPEEPSWGDLKGQTLVLDFWATWCAPCVADIPRMNSIADWFSGQPVRFIAITDEDGPTVARFLHRVPIHGWVGLDPDGSGKSAYGVTGIPQAALIYPDGRLAGVTHTSEVTVEVVEDLMAGKPIHLNPHSGVTAIRDSILARYEANRHAQPLEESYFRIEVFPRDEERRGNHTFSPRQRLVSASKSRAEHLLAALFASRELAADALPRDRLDFIWSFLRHYEDPAGHLQRDLDIDISAPTIPEPDFLGWVLDHVLDTLGVDLVAEERMADALVLRRIPGVEPRLKASQRTPRSSSSDGVLTGQGLSLADIAAALARTLERPTFDETGLEGTYDYLVRADATIDFYAPSVVEVDLVRMAIRDQLGLALEWDQRPATVYVVQPRTP